MKIKFLLVILSSSILLCCAAPSEKKAVKKEAFTPELLAKLDTAYFANGCFWCTEAIFERVNGVVDVVSGYAGGSRPNPTYTQVSMGLTKYAEAVRIVYDPEVVSYKLLIEFFYASHDPTQLNRQGNDIGAQYRSEVYYKSKEEKELAIARKEYLDKSGKYSSKIVTLISEFTNFYDAEDYHQDYYKNNPRQPYVYSVSRPKVEKFVKEYQQYLKPEFQS